MLKQQDDGGTRPESLPSRTLSRYSSLLVAGVVLTTSAHANTFADLNIEVGNEHNISRGFRAQDRFNDEYLSVHGGLGKFLQLRPGQAVTLSVFGAAQHFHDLRGMDSVLGGALATYNHKFGLGAYAPEMTLALAMSQENLDGRARDRQLHDLTLSIGKRLSPAWSLYAAVTHEYSQGVHDGSSPRDSTYPWAARKLSNDVFDFTQTLFLASVDYTFYNSSMLTASVSLINDGHTVSSSQTPNPRLAVISTAIADDPAFHPEPGHYQATYTIDTDSYVYALDWSLVLATDTSLTLGYEYRDIESRAALSYRSSSLRMRLSWAY